MVNRVLDLESLVVNLVLGLVARMGEAIRNGQFFCSHDAFESSPPLYPK
jgi:hypothetical protein